MNEKKMNGPFFANYSEHARSFHIGNKCQQIGDRQPYLSTASSECSHTCLVDISFGHFNIRKTANLDILSPDYNMGILHDPND